MSKEALIVKLSDRMHNVKYLDKNCNTKQHLNFVKKYWKETVEIIVKLNYKNRGNEVELLVRGINYYLDYLKIKYKW